MSKPVSQPFAKRTGPQNAALYYMSKRNYAARDADPSDDLTSYAWGTLTMSVNQQNSDTVTFGGTTVTFGSGHNVAIGATKEDTVTNLAAYCNASADTNLSKCTYRATDNVLKITRKIPGDASFTLAVLDRASHATLSGSTLQLIQIRKRPVL